MNTATKLASFGAVVALSFGAAAAVGAAVGPIDVGTGGGRGGGGHMTNDRSGTSERDAREGPASVGDDSGGTPGAPGAPTHEGGH